MSVSNSLSLCLSPSSVLCLSHNVYGVCVWFFLPLVLYLSLSHTHSISFFGKPLEDNPWQPHLSSVWTHQTVIKEVYIVSENMIPDIVTNAWAALARRISNFQVLLSTTTYLWSFKSTRWIPKASSEIGCPSSATTPSTRSDRGQNDMSPCWIYSHWLESQLSLTSLVWSTHISHPLSCETRIDCPIPVLRYSRHLPCSRSLWD
jgi:hypothetical protein